MKPSFQKISLLPCNSLWHVWQDRSWSMVYMRQIKWIISCSISVGCFENNLCTVLNDEIHWLWNTLLDAWTKLNVCINVIFTLMKWLDSSNWGSNNLVTSFISLKNPLQFDGKSTACALATWRPLLVSPLVSALARLTRRYGTSFVQNDRRDRLDFWSC